MKIHSNLRWLSATGLCGLVIFAAVAFAALLQIEVNGPIYKRISLSKDLISAYVPPSQSLLQAALICGMMGKASDPVELQRYENQFDAAREDFETQHADYMRRVPEGKLKELMRGTAFQSGEQYFQIAHQTYIPLILRGNHEEAQNVLVKQTTVEERQSIINRVRDIIKRKQLQRDSRYEIQRFQDFLLVLETGPRDDD